MPLLLLVLRTFSTILSALPKLDSSSTISNVSFDTAAPAPEAAAVSFGRVDGPAGRLYDVDPGGAGGMHVRSTGLGIMPEDERSEGAEAKAIRARYGESG